MLPSVNVIYDAATRNNIALETLAYSIFNKNADKFLEFLQNPKLSLDISYSQLSLIAKELKIPFGYLFLDKLPKENTKIAELRNKNPEYTLSQVLKESIKNSEYKQMWYRDYLIDIGEEPKYSIKLNDEELIIKKIKALVRFDTLPKSDYKALQRMVSNLQKENFLIFIAGRIERSNKKKIDIKDCRGYCLYDEYAPTIFINIRDSYKGKIFTLLHELAHIFYSDNAITFGDNQHYKLEKICNNIAGEILIPKDIILKLWDKTLDISENVVSLNKKFYLASNEAIATKARVLRLISQAKYEEYIKEYNTKPTKLYARKDEKRFFKTIARENSINFVEAIITQTHNNKIDFKTAMEYLGIEKMGHLEKVQKEFGLYKEK